MAKSGDKKRLVENKSFLSKLQTALIFSHACFALIRLGAKHHTAGFMTYAGFACTVILSFASFSGLKLALSPAYASNGELIYAGADLKSGGVLEYYQDVAYLCIFAMFLGCFTDWAWLVFCLVPVYGLFLAWKYLLVPWVNSSPPKEIVEDEETRKRREKKERQAARREKFAVKRQ